MRKISGMSGITAALMLGLFSGGGTLGTTGNVVVTDGQTSQSVKQANNVVDRAGTIQKVAESTPVKLGRNDRRGPRSPNRMSQKKRRLRARQLGLV